MFNDFEFLSDLTRWPTSQEGIPYCCLKGTKGIGYITGLNPLLVNIGCIFEPTVDEDLILYNSVQEILDDGWLVD